MQKSVSGSFAARATFLRTWDLEAPGSCSLYFRRMRFRHPSTAEPPSINQMADGSGAEETVSSEERPYKLPATVLF